MKIKALIILILLLLASMITVAAPAKKKNTGSFTITGDRSVTYDSAKVAMSYTKGIKIWNIRISTPYDFKKKTGSGYIVSLFFSRKFIPGKGKFPVKFSYLNKKNTLGGSLVVMGKNRGMFSHDTDGEINFTEFSDTIKGEFQFTAIKKKRDNQNETVTIKGSFSCLRKNAFR